ncbi:MAG: Na+/H+ antiporter NhaC family protein [Bacteroidetes bacterium]|nr:Na+/H+ antiporter NhaC family protein [Bacteroidota bacterium]
MAVLFTLLTLSFSALAQDGNTSLLISWTSLLPPLITIVLALILREVITSLVVGVLVGTVLIWWNGGDGGWLTPILYVPMNISESLFDKDHLAVILFTLLIGATVSVVNGNGGMMALVKRISARAKSRRSVQLSTWMLGIAIFFDDYANTLVVGKTMRPLTDRYKVSREKLAYIVDSTAAPIAAIAFVTTWIGAEVGYVDDGLKEIVNRPMYLTNAYSIFLSSLQYAFYPILTILFMFMLIWKQRDFGPMLVAERKAISGEVSHHGSGKPAEVDTVPDDKEYLLNAILPIGVLLVGAVAGLIYTGLQTVSWNESVSFVGNLSSIISASDPYTALIWASFLSVSVAVVMTVVTEVHGLSTTIELALDGIKLMIPAIAILVLAWTLSAITSELETGRYLASLIGDGFSPSILPAVVFILSAVVAFSTGSSWGTMSIIYPIVLVTTWSICERAGLDAPVILSIFANTVSAVLAGAVLGDHCSPISDTTILSSMASECNHIDHVRTQLPYALTVGGVATVLGTLPAGFGVPWFVTFPLCLIALYLIVSYFGKRP